MNNDLIYKSKLYGLVDDLNKLINLYDKNLLTNKILLSGNEGIGKYTLVNHFINYIFSKDEEHMYDLKNNSINSKNRSYKLYINNSHPNIFNIDLLKEKKNIEIGQVREMMNYANKSSFNDKPRFVIINNVEELNTNSSNALLKIVEEPNENLYFILIYNNSKNILDTLKSRCLVFKLNLTFEQTISISSKILNNDVHKILNNELINYYSTPGEIINFVNFANKYKINLKENSLKDLLILLIDGNYYTKDNFIKNYIFNLIQIYFLKISREYKSKNINLFYNKFVQMNYYCKNYNLNLENLYIEFKSKVLNG